MVSFTIKGEQMTETGFKPIRPPEFFERCRRLLMIPGCKFSVVFRLNEATELLASYWCRMSEVAEELHEIFGLDKITVSAAGYEIEVFPIRIKEITRFQFKGCVGPQNVQTLIEALNSEAFGNNGSEKIITEDSLVALVTFSISPA